MKKLFFALMMAAIVLPAMGQTVASEAIEEDITPEVEKTDVEAAVPTNEAVEATPAQSQDAAMCASSTVQTSSTPATAGPELILRDGNTYYYAGGVYKRNEMQTQLMSMSMPVYNKYSKGNKMAKIGWGLLGAGLGLDITGVIFMYAVDELTGSVLGIMGGMCETASVPLLIVGYCRMHDAVDDYNMYAAYSRPQTYWSVNASPNGIGIAYNF